MTAYGSRRLRILSITAFVAATMVLSGCSKPREVKSIRVEKTRVETTVATTSSGTVEADQQAVLGFGVTGRVMKIRARPGDRVAEGTILAEIENGDLQATERNAQREYANARELFKGGLISQSALDEARRAAEVARTSLDRAVIRAPFAGIVTEMNLELGEIPQAAPGGGASAPIRLVDLKPRLIKGVVDEVDLARVKVGETARIRIPAVRKDPFQGIVTRVVPFISTIREQDRTSQVEFRISDKLDPLSLPVGASADIEIVVEAKENTLSIPTRALLGTSKSRHVFVIDDGKAAKREVTAGIGNYERIEITSGLKDGDVIALPPDDFELVEGMKVKPAAADKAAAPAPGGKAME